MMRFLSSAESFLLLGAALNGVGRNRACRMVWRAEVGDLTRMRRRGWRRMYLGKMMECQ